MPTKFNYPLLENAFSNDDINKAMQVLKLRYITMSKKTKEFEKYFAPSGSFGYDEPTGMHLGSFTLRTME